MATFEITAPNGKKYRIQGENKEGALAALQKHLGQSAQPSQKNPDGTYGTPPEGMFVNPETGQMTSREMLANAYTKNEPPTARDAAGMGYMQGFSLNTTDELMGGLGYIEGGPDMARLRREQSRALMDAAQSEQGGAYLAGNLGGAVVTPANRVFGPAKSVKGAAAQGGGSAVAYAAGDAEGNAGERLAEAAPAFVPGALFGAGAKKAIDVGTDAFRALFNKTAQRPTVEGLRATKNAAYRAVDEAGEAFQPSELQGLAERARRVVDDFDYVPETDLQTKAALAVIDSRSGQPLTLGQLDRVRQNLWKRYNQNPNEAGILAIIDEIDDLVQSRQSTSGLMSAAREANARYKKAELLDLAFQKAEDQTASTGSGGNILNKYRQAVTSIINNPKKAKWFTKEEIETMRNFVQGSLSENVMRRIGKLSPSGNGLMMALNLGAAAVNPAMLGFTAAGAAAKEMAERSTERGRQGIMDMVAGASAKAPAPANPLPAVPGWIGSQF